MTSSGGATPRQLTALNFFKNRTVNPSFDRLANESIDFDYKLRPDSRFSQYDLDRFNRRQDEARRQFSQLYGGENLRDITRYDRVEDIPRYTEEELRQQKIERLKANPKSAYNYKRPEEPAFGEGPRNQKVPQAVVDAYNNLTAKFGQLRDNIRSGKSGSPVGRADFDAIFTAAKNAKPEFIQEGEVYEGPDFRDPGGKLLRERASSTFNPERVDFLRERVFGQSPKRDFGASPLIERDSVREAVSGTEPARRPVSETRETGRAREAGRPRFNADRSVEERKEMREKRRARRAASAKVAARFKERRRAKRAAKGFTRKAANF